MVQTVDSLDGLFQPPSTLPTLTKDTTYIGTSSTTEVSDETELKEAVKTSGSITLKNDITLTSTLTISSNVTVNLDLGGHTLKASDSFTDENLIKITSDASTGGTLIVTNGTLDGNNNVRCVFVGTDISLPCAFTLGKGATIQNGSGGNGAGVFVNYGTFTMEEGSRITNCHGTPYGGAVGVTLVPTNEFKMEGGCIEGCMARMGGAVYSGGTFIMKGGTIENCSATGDNDKSNAVYNIGTFNAYGGEIKGTVHNTVNDPEYGEYRGTITSSGAGATTFSDTVYNGGTISGGTFYAGIQGNGTVDYAKITLGVSPEELQTKLSNAQSGDVLNLKLKTDGELTSTLTISSNVTVNLDLGGHTLKASSSFNNSSNSYGLIWVDNGNLTVTNGTLDGNNKVRCVYVGWSGTGSFALGAGATIQNGLGNNGGGVFINKGTFTMLRGSKVTDCVASGAGGAVCVSGGGTDDTNQQFIMNDGTIEKCTAGDGGAVDNNALFIMNSGTIENCKSTRNNSQGNGVANSGTFHANGGEIKDTVYNNNGGNTVYRGVIDSQNGKTGTTFSGITYNGGTINGGNFSDIVMLDGGTLADNVQPSGTLTYIMGGYTVTGLGEYTYGDPVAITVEPENAGSTGTVQYVKNAGASDEIVSEELPRNVGTYKVQIKEANNTIVIPRPFTIKPADVTADDFVVSTPKNAVADGTEYSAEVAIRESCKFADELKNHYEVSYQKKNGEHWEPATAPVKDAGTYRVVIAVNNNAGASKNTANFNKAELTDSAWEFTVATKPESKPDDTKKDDDKPGTEEPAKPVVTYALTVKNAEVTIENAGKTVETTKNEDGTLTAKVPEGAKVTVKYTAPTDAIVFDLWSITSDAKLDVNVKENPLTFTMPDKAVTIEAMTRDATIESEGPGILGTAAMIGVGVAGTAVLGYQGYMIGTELYLNSVLPEGAAIPQNYGELAKLVWDNAGRPEPIALLAADATDEQKALTWAVENQLISADKAADASVTRWEVIQAWNKEQEMKKV